MTTATVLSAVLAVGVTAVRAGQAGWSSGELRLWAGLVDPNHYGVLIAMVFALVLVGRQQRTALRWQAAVLILLGAEILTLSRGGLISLAVGVATAMLLLLWIPKGFVRLGIGRRATAVIVLCVLGGVAVALVAPSFTETAVDRYVKIGNPDSDASATLRLRIWDTAGKLLDEAPYLGIGPGAFINATGETGDFVQGFEAHNSFLETAVEVGYIAAGCLVALLLWAAAAGVSGVRRLSRAVDTDRLALGVGTLAAFTAGIVGALTLSNFLYQAPFILICILLIGATVKESSTLPERL